MTKSIGYIVLVLFLAYSCSTNEKEVVDINDVIPQSNRDYDANSSGVAEKDSTILPQERFAKNGIEVEELTFIHSKHFPDRVGPVRSEKYGLRNTEFTFEYYNWVYEDSAKVMNAFYNWLDFLGIDQVGDRKRIQDEYLLILVGDSNLVYVNASAGATSKEWLAYHDSLGYDKNWNYMIEQYAKRQAKWFTFDKGKKQEIKTN
jgi:hypothetical protein